MKERHTQICFFRYQTSKGSRYLSASVNICTLVLCPLIIYPFFLACFYHLHGIQDPMRGGKDDMFEDLIGMIHAGDSEALARDSSAPPRKRLVPEFMLKLARSVCPF